MKRKERGEKGKPRHRWSVTNLPFVFFISSSRGCLHAMKKLPLPCTFAVFTHGMRFQTLIQESFDQTVHLNNMNAAGEVTGCLLIVVWVVYKNSALKLHNSVKQTQSKVGLERFLRHHSSKGWLSQWLFDLR